LPVSTNACALRATQGQLLAGQLTGIMTLVLVAAAAVSVFPQDIVDAIVTLTIVALNGARGYVQESRAEQSITARKLLSAPPVRIRRAGGARSLGVRHRAWRRGAARNGPRRTCRWATVAVH